MAADAPPVTGFGVTVVPATVKAGGPPAKVAVTRVATFPTTVHGAVPVQPPPDHPVKLEPGPGVAVRVIGVVPSGSVQSSGHWIPAGELVTVPSPVPARATVSVTVLSTSNVSALLVAAMLGSATVPDAVPTVATSAAGITALSCVGATNVVGRSAPFQRTTEAFVKPPPRTDRVRSGDPATTRSGVIEVRVSCPSAEPTCTIAPTDGTPLPFNANST